MSTEARQRVLQVLSETLGAPSRSSGGWKGYSAPLGGAQVLAPGNRDFSSQPWPYRTESAEVLWRHVIKLLDTHRELNDQMILQKGLEVSGISPLDISPEDWRLLEMAIEWRRNGLKGIKMPRIGGAPGGPFDPREYGHELGKRGAP